MSRIQRNKLLVVLSVLIFGGLIVYFLIYKAVLGETGQYIGGFTGFFIITAFIGTFAKSKQQLDNELKYMGKVHDNHRPRKFG